MYKSHTKAELIEMYKQADSWEGVPAIDRKRWDRKFGEKAKTASTTAVEGVKD